MGNLPLNRSFYISSVKEITRTDILKSHYDLCLFASGYEERSIRLSQELSNLSYDVAQVFGFAEHRNDSQRLLNDNYYRTEWNCEPIILSASDESPMYPIIDHLLRDKIFPSRILVDYSSMSRLWYMGVLNYLRHARPGRTIEIDFIYSLALYREEYPPMTAEGAQAIPGCEGVPSGLMPTVGIIGLGFDNLATQSIIEQLQADRIFVFYAQPGAERKYSKLARAINKDIIAGSDNVVEIPLSKVSTAFRILTELSVDFLSTHNVVFVPMGPKPHILASLLVAVEFPAITCLRVIGRRAPCDPAIPNGKFVFTRVRFGSVAND